MKTRRVLSGLLSVLGLALAIGTIWIVIGAVDAAPAMLMRPESAVDRAQALLDAVCDGDYETASEMLYGTPSLGTRPENSSPAVDLIWDAFLDSLEYTLLGDCYATDSGVAMDVRVRSLDISGVVDGLDSRAQALLNQRIAAAEDSTDIYDENNDFRQELITEVLQEAVRQALTENKTYQEQTISLQLVYEQGQWWVMPETTLLNVLAGSISG